MSLNLDREAFYRRIKRLYQGWRKEGTKINGCDALIAVVGQNDEDQYRWAFSHFFFEIFFFEIFFF